MQGEQPLHFLATVCSDFHKEYTRDLDNALEGLMQTMMDVGAVQKSARRRRARCQTASCNDDILERAGGIVDELTSLYRCLEEIHSIAAETPQMLRQHFSLGRFPFQLNNVSFPLLTR